MENLMNLGLFAYILLNFGLSFVLPTYRVWRKTGVSPITFSDSDNAHDFIGRVFKVLLVALVITGGIYAFYTGGVPFLMPISYLESPNLQIVGWAILLVALAWIVVAQFQMANSWRIGIDETNPTDLVTRGVFGWSRNPIFLGMLTTLVGLFFVIPNLITFSVAAIGLIVVPIQVRLEEEFLRKAHGETYANYCIETRRWL